MGKYIVEFRDCVWCSVAAFVEGVLCRGFEETDLLVLVTDLAGEELDVSRQQFNVRCPPNGGVRLLSKLRCHLRSESIVTYALFLILRFENLTCKWGSRTRLRMLWHMLFQDRWRLSRFRSNQSPLIKQANPFEAMTYLQ
jgi:hypothetical protein